MSETKRQLQAALPFAMEPVVYDFAINERGTWGDCLTGTDAILAQDYYALHVPRWLRADLRSLPPSRRAELNKFSTASRTSPALAGVVQRLFDHLLPRLQRGAGPRSIASANCSSRVASIAVQHEQIRNDIRDGRIGLPQNRLPVSADVKDVRAGDVVHATRPVAGRPSAAGHRRPRRTASWP